MRLTICVAAWLLLALATSDSLAMGASGAIRELEGKLVLRLKELDAVAEIDKAGRKRRKAIASCLREMGKTREDLRADVGLLEDIVKKLGKRFRVRAPVSSSSVLE